VPEGAARRRVRVPPPEDPHPPIAARWAPPFPRGRGVLIGLAFILSATVAAAADIKEKLEPCLQCHGGEGQSQVDDVPSLGGQLPQYSVIQLFMFREKMRVAEPMNEMAKDLSDGDLQTLADALAALPPPKPPAEAGDPARMEHGRELAAQHRCNICHRPDFAGQQTVPRLAGQREDYLLKALRGYKSGTRHAYEPIMLEVLQPLEDAQLVELSYYLAHFR
jgi:cytochrome c553